MEPGQQSVTHHRGPVPYLPRHRDSPHPARPRADPYGSCGSIELLSGLSRVEYRSGNPEEGGSLGIRCMTGTVTCRSR